MTIYNWLDKNDIPYQDKDLIIDGFTHTSYINENPHIESQYERLEFIGDSVLQLWVSNRLFMLEPKLNEGEMTTYRASIVCEEALVSYAKKLKLNQFLRLGTGEERTGGRSRDSILADMMEAFLGALYVDTGYASVDKVLNMVIEFNSEAEIRPAIIDYKTKLQEYIQSDVRGSLVYEVVSMSGPSNNPEFTIQVVNEGINLGRGVGSSKKRAEQNAAKDAFLKLVK
ncbi:MAG: ribonuclease III [Erysipelothrix sp.]|nr:ribonuclease III [Erysipelothrix sp.]